MERGEFDLIAVGRALLADPQWVEKVRDGRRDELRDFDPAAMACAGLSVAGKSAFRAKLRADQQGRTCS